MSIFFLGNEVKGNKEGEKIPPNNAGGQNKKQKLWTNTHPENLYWSSKCFQSYYFERGL